MLLSDSQPLEEVFALFRGVIGLVGYQLDDIDFIKRLHAVVRIADGEPPGLVAKSLGMSKTRALGAFEAARAGGIGAIIKAAPTPRPAFDMAVTLFVGRLTETVFERRYRNRLEAWGYVWKDWRGSRNEVDFGVELDGRPVLDINTKNASTQYRNAAQLGLDPARIVPLGMYKLLAGRKSREPRPVPFVFAFLVDWGLSAKAQLAGRKTLNDDELRAAALLLNVDEKGKRKAEDAAVEAMFERSKGELIPLADTADEFETIGLARAMSVLLENFDTRAPALRNTRSWQGQIGYFIKMSEEMTPWPMIMELLEHKNVEELANRITNGQI